MKLPSLQDFESEKQAERHFSSTKFPPLPADEYVMEVVNFEETKGKKYQSEELEDSIKFTLEFKRLREPTDEPMKDTEGGDATGRTMFFWLSPDRLGFTKTGTPSISRQFIGYCLGVQDIQQDFELQSWRDLIGKKVLAEVVVGTTSKGKKVNKAVRFIKPPRRA